MGGLTIHEPHSGIPTKTGLLDQYGTPLYRVTESEPIGFVMTKRE
jgi:hypothetical protein